MKRDWVTRLVGQKVTVCTKGTGAVWSAETRDYAILDTQPSIVDPGKLFECIFEIDGKYLMNNYTKIVGVYMLSNRWNLWAVSSLLMMPFQRTKETTHFLVVRRSSQDMTLVDDSAMRRSSRCRMRILMTVLNLHEWLAILPGSTAKTSPQKNVGCMTFSL